MRGNGAWRGASSALHLLRQERDDLREGIEQHHHRAYSLKKLVAAGLVLTEKVGKEVIYSPSPTGEAAVQQYREVRETCLIDNLDAGRNPDIGEMARLLRTMSGLYDQAARAATSL